MKQTLRCVFVSCTLLLMSGCCAFGPQEHASNCVPRLVDFVERDENGATLYEEYKGERMFTVSYLTNDSGAKVTSIYCGHQSDHALVHRRIYAKDGKVVREEAITSTDPMVLALRTYDHDTGDLVYEGWITQGESRQHFRRFCHQKLDK